MTDTECSTGDDSTRAYLEINPSDTPISADGLVSAFERLHDTDPAVQLEWLLVGSDDGVAYYLGTDAEEIDSVEHDVASVFPNETTIRRTEAPNDVLDRLEADIESSDAATDEEATADDAPPADSGGSSAAIEFYGNGDRRGDWVTRLTPVTGRPATGTPNHGQPGRRQERSGTSPGPNPDAGTSIRSPLARAVDTLADAPDETTIVYQAVLEPFDGDWAVDGALRIDDLEWHQDTLGQQVSKYVFSDFEKRDRDELHRASRTRIQEIEAADTSNAFAVASRAYLEGPDAESLARELENTFAPVDGEFYHVDQHRTTGSDATDVLANIRERTLETEHGLTRRLIQRLPIAPNSRPALITDSETAPAFCILDGSALNGPGRDALETTPGEKSGVSPPTDEQLDTYDRPGLTLGRALDSNDDATDRTVAVPPARQPLHVAWFGATGSGKSVALAGGLFDNVAATDGPDILLDSKGDGMAVEYLQAHYARHGDLEDVYYFDCSKVVPAIPFFDISDALEAGVPRASAVENTVDHYVEILRGIMGPDAFEAKRAPDVIRYLLKALYDPVHGSDAFTQSDLVAAANRMKVRSEAPPVSDPQLEQQLENVTEDNSDVFQAIMTGVDTRVEKVSRDTRIARLFEHTPPEAAASEAAIGHTVPDGGHALEDVARDGDEDGWDTPEDTLAAEDATGSDPPADHPSFDIAEYLDEDAVVILDTGGLRADAQRALSMVVLSNLWTALRQRERRRADRPGAGTETDGPPLVNLYVEEAADVADTSLMTDLLSKSRSFGLSVTLAMQYPGQLEETAPRMYSEVLNNVSTIVAGKVGRDPPLADRLATDDMPPGDVANRLRGLRRGQWLATLPAGFDETEPRPFLLESAAPPAGHPASDEPLTRNRHAAFEAVRFRRAETVRKAAGLTVAQPSVVDRAREDSAASEDATDDDDATDDLRHRVDTTLPYTARLPDHVSYDGDRHALTCTGCDAVYDPDSVGLERALDCCPDGEVDPDDVPICEVTLKLTREEREACAYTDGQLMFLQAVYNAAQMRYEPPHYDILHDSMLRLQEYVGIGADAVDELLDDGLLRHDGDHPHRLYTVSAAGRDLLGEKHRHGVAYGHGKGDLGEGSPHAMTVEGARQWHEQVFVADPDSEVETVIPYYELDDDDLADDCDLDLAGDGSGNVGRLDVAGLDADGNIVTCIEVERINNDVAEAVPADYDKMAACNPEEAIWIVMSQAAGHDVLDALNDTGRVEKTYSSTTPPQSFRIDEPGLTGMYGVQWIRRQLR